MIPLASFTLHAAAAVFCLGWSIVTLLAGRGSRHATGLAAAPIAAALWLGLVAASPATPLDGLAGAAEVLRSVAWFVLLLLLYRRAGGARMAAPVTRFAIGGGVLAAAALISLVPGLTQAIVVPSLGSPALLARLGLAVATVLLAENLYRNADEAARWHVNLPCIALGSVSIIDILLYADAVLGRSFSPAMLDARAVLTALAMPLFAIAAGRGRRLRRPIQLSRDVAFHGATLVVAGTFLLGIGAAGEMLRQLGADWSRAVQISLGAAVLMGLAVAAASQTARSRVRRLVVDHFFAARYDYRREWLRCVDTLSAGEEGVEAPVRAIRAIADPADSPAGTLLLRDPLEGAEAGAAATPRYVWAGAWNMPQRPTLALPAAHPLILSLRGGNWVALLEGSMAEVDDAALNDLGLGQAFGRLWLAVPLLHDREGLVGVVLLGTPRAAFPLDVETFDLLRTLGQEVAMFLAERRAAERLVDQRQLQDYAKRFAFVAHDVKTVSSQLSLLLANAEDNIADPEFQRDMLLTVRASAERINALIARLRQPEAETGAPRQAAAPLPTPAPAETIDPVARLATLTAGRAHPIVIAPAAEGVGAAAIDATRFDAAVTHLLDNAIEASSPGVAVSLAVRRQDGRIAIDITDQGPGMSPEFVRDQLFRPLATSKPQGSGIGAWQARELLREVGGELSVLTSPGAGTTMRLWLPPASVTTASGPPHEGTPQERLRA
ncbi:XrtA/PEP-CTERM system histidine kinase PrsK [Elioraea sp.]|uniref:XrtA/PEP-CTERM system histidine kinase PrsK n=1 Tax=Elioraea sp. TaxID=2185103 RepID=UPI0025C3AD49|nr:XrtA/PEP-CTERM system histidine kinase PrsK [Elioraea sp.]